MSGKPFLETVQDAVRTALQQKHEAIDAECWKMLDPRTNPHRWGVLVIESDPLLSDFQRERNHYSITVETKIGLHPDVPFGEIHYKRGKTDD